MAVRCHEACCRLIVCVDVIAGYFFGAMLMLAVPYIAITLSTLTNLLQNKHVFSVVIILFLGFLICLATFIYLAAAIHEEVSDFSCS